MEKKILGQPLSIWISIIMMIPITFFVIKYRMRIFDDIELTLMRLTASSKDYPLKVYYVSNNLSQEELIAKVNSFKTVYPDYDVLLDSLGYKVSRDKWGHYDGKDYYDLLFHLPDIDMFITCEIQGQFIRVYSYYENPPTYTKERGFSIAGDFYEFTVVKRRYRDKRQTEVLDSIDKMMRKIDPSLKPYEPYVY